MDLATPDHIQFGEQMKVTHELRQSGATFCWVLDGEATKQSLVPSRFATLSVHTAALEIPEREAVFPLERIGLGGS